jgi:hypothetical protein
MNREGVMGSLLVCDGDSSVLVRWRKVTPSIITAYLRVLVQSNK